MSATASDDVTRGARLRAVTVGRLLALAVFALYLATLGRDLVDPAGASLLVAVAVGHLVVNAVSLIASQRRDALPAVIELTALMDAAAIAVVLAVTGGIASPLAWLVLAEAVAVTLVFGWGGGVRIAAVLSIALLWVRSVDPPTLPQAVDAVRPVDGSLALALDPDLRAVWLLLGLWAVTGLVGVLNGVTERDLRRWLTDLTMLRQVTRQLDPRRGVDRVCEALATTMVDQLDYRGAVVWLTHEGRLKPVAQAGHGGGDAVEEAALLSPSEHPIATAVERDTPTLVKRNDVRPGVLQRAHGPDAPLALLPLRIDGRLLAVISAEVNKPLLGAPSLRGGDLRRLSLLADEASLLLDNARLQADLRSMATTDGLTGLPNHRYLQQRLTAELSRVSRSSDLGEQRVLSVALFDLDFFKRINDTYGHPTGDAVLVGVSRRAQDLLRTSDVVCRYGGEEFAVILVDTSAPEARRACERLGDAIRALEFESEDGRDLGTVTASFGIATTVGTALDRAELIAGADRALYAAKRAGRDRVVHLEDLDEDDEDEGTRTQPRTEADLPGMPVSDDARLGTA
ncbi:diguanylate cyclase [Egicoccus sp. AB-alg2]|uniref:GGDEF domain-containing protein n=1 Tax=Egicoccus sp. AB-alg2 TaxID=3242693 RepID=UPI00359DD760